jgi:hypothetical protein
MNDVNNNNTYATGISQGTDGEVHIKWMREALAEVLIPFYPIPFPFILSHSILLIPSPDNTRS